MKKKILVVDDDRVILLFMRNLLEREGHHVVTAKDGFAALDILTSYTPDIMFVDLIMPRIDGDKLCQIVRKMHHLNDCFIVLISAAIAESGIDPFQTGANTCIAKGNLSKMSGHVLEALKKSDSLWKEKKPTPIMGIEDAYSRQITKELLAKNLHLKTILESMTEGIIELFSNRIIYANSAALSLFGLPQEKLLNSYFPDFFHKKDLCRVKMLCDQGKDRVSEIGSEIGIDMPLVLNGKKVTVRNLPVKGVDSTTIALLKDVTEQIEMEVHRKKTWQRIERLNHMQERLLGPSNLVEKLKIITGSVVEIFNADVVRIWMTKPGDLCAAGCIHAHVPDGQQGCPDRDRCLHLMASSGRYSRVDGKDRRIPFGCYEIGRIAAGEVPKYITNKAARDPYIHDHGWVDKLGLVSFAGYQLLSPTGKPAGVLALFRSSSLSYDEDELLEGIASTAAQVIQTATAEESLREEKEKYRNLTENIPDLVYSIDKNGNISAINKALNSYGYNYSEIIGQPFTKFIYNKDVEKVVGAFHEAINTQKEESQGLRFRMITKDNAIRWIELNSHMQFDQDGNFIQGEGVCRDITNRKKAEDLLQESRERYRSFARIGQALSVEKNINKLLEMVVDEARNLSNADAGTLYILDENKKHLCFAILQNDTMNTRMGGANGDEISMPDVLLYKDGIPNFSNVSSYVALTDKIVNIPDVYKAEEFDFTGPKNYDASTGYRSKSMLVIPMKNHENDIIGVLQLLNSMDSETGEVIAFSPEYVDLVASLASQAAVALTNTQLIQNLKNLFYAFIKSIATAIDEKSPYTGGHINRVVYLTMMIAEKVNENNEATFKDVYFNENEIEELRMAAWMHDVGKITTPEYVVDKSSKLQTILDRILLIETRFQLIAGLIENKQLYISNDLYRTGTISETKIEDLNEALARELNSLQEQLDFIIECNSPDKFMTDDDVKRIQEIAEQTYSLNNKTYSYVTKDELYNLCIRKGTLTAEERNVIENHAAMTKRILDQLPFPKNLENVPKYAGSHHEKLDGSGYPQRFSGKQLSLQSRILAIADIFEALTARDRPYKDPMKLTQAIKILGFMKNDNHIDPDIYNLCIKSGIFLEYAKKEMNPDQIDDKEMNR